MLHSLAQLWKETPAFLQAKSFRQIIQVAGDGRLRDGNQTSKELREWLGAISLQRLRQCAEECLAGSFEDSGHALQDAVNELGVRLGFGVTPGRYRGVKSDIGNDGIWSGEDGFRFVVEVKTTDTYRINLDTLATYRKELIANGTITEESSSILIAVGRQDTGDLEAQIRGSSHAWDIRLISVDALLRLAEVKEQLNDWSTSNKINQLLRPVEYTRLDGIVELLFATKQDLATTDPVAPILSAESEALPREFVGDHLEAVRDAALRRIEKKLNTTFVKRGKVLRASADGRIRLVCLASQRHEGTGDSSNYWYGYSPAQRDFLNEAEVGYLALVCGDSGKAYLISRDEIHGWLSELPTTTIPDSDELRHWHINFNDSGYSVQLNRIVGGKTKDLIQYRLP